MVEQTSVKWFDERVKRGGCGEVFSIRLKRETLCEHISGRLNLRGGDVYPCFQAGIFIVTSRRV